MKLEDIKEGELYWLRYDEVMYLEGTMGRMNNRIVRVVFGFDTAPHGLVVASLDGKCQIYASPEDLEPIDET